MPLTVAEEQAQVLYKVGLTSASPWAMQMPILWRKYDVYPTTQAFYLVAVDLLDYILADLTEQGACAKTETDLNAIRAQRETRQTQRTAIQNEYNRWLANRAPLAGVLTTTAIIPSPTDYVDANSTAYGGDPNVRPTIVQRMP